MVGRARRGETGDYYLVYFGKERPTTWRFELNQHQLTDGHSFPVEILDTWNMTVTAVPATFVTKKKDDYLFEDAAGKSVTLPAQPYLALHIRCSPP